MIIPIGAASVRRIVPKATIALIVVNVIVFYATAPLVVRDWQRLLEAHFALQTIEMRVEAVHLELPRSDRLKGFLSSAFGKRTRTQERFWQDFARGAILPVHDPEWIAWNEAHEALDRAWRDHLLWRWGVSKANPNPLTLVTATFLHADFFHLLGNMLFLWTVGVNMEQVWGRRFFLLLYLLGGIAASIPDALLAPPGSMEFSIGASGAVAAVMGAFMVRHFGHRIRFFSLLVYYGTFSVKAGYVLPAWFALDLYHALTTEQGEGGVAFWAHVGGFVLGAGMALAFKAGRVEETHVAADLERQDRDNRKAKAMELVERLRQRGRGDDLVKAIDAATAIDPDDVALRLEKALLQHRLDDRAGVAAEAEALLRHLWHRGDRDGYLAAFGVLEPLVDGALPPAAFYKAALACEKQDPHRAASLLHRATQADRSDPLLPQALERYAGVLERLGARAEADQVRAYRQALPPRPAPG